MVDKWQGGLSGAASGAAVGTMITPGIGTAIGAGIGGLAGLLGTSDDDESEALRAQALAELEALGEAPDLNKVGKTFQYEGDYNPFLEQSLGQYESAAAKLREDPANRARLLQGINALQRMSQTGLSASDIAAYNQLKQRSEVEAQARQQALMQNMQQRGLGGSGAELIASLQGSQAADTRKSEEADRLAAMRSEGSKRALEQFLGASSGLRSQDYQTQANKLSAKDIESQYNLTNSTNRQMRNIAAQNQAGLRNIDTRQQVSSSNVNLWNQNIQNRYNQELARRQAMANARLGQAGMAMQQSANNNAWLGNMFQTAGQGAQTYMGYKQGLANQDYQKERDKVQDAQFAEWMKSRKPA